MRPPTRRNPRIRRRPLAVGLAVLGVLIALMCGQHGALALSQSQKNRRWDRVWKAKRKECGAKGKCATLHPDENDNCVNECTSAACYAEVYAAEPLEPGEVDMPRWRSFERCVRREAREARRNRYRNQRTEV